MRKGILAMMMAMVLTAARPAQASGHALNGLNDLCVMFGAMAGIELVVAAPLAIAGGVALANNNGGAGIPLLVAGGAVATVDVLAIATLLHR